MPLRDLFRKKDKEQDTPPSQPTTSTLTSTSPAPEPTPGEGFTFLRTDTNTKELIHPPTFPAPPPPPPPSNRPQHERRPSHLRLRKSSNASTASSTTSKNERRLSDRLHLRGPHSRTTSQSSIHVPSDLPSIIDGAGDKDDQEAQWERRATLLATSGIEEAIEGLKVAQEDDGIGATGAGSKGRKRGTSVSDPKTDENIQEAIRLHESGDLERSTAMFGRLADPSGANNPLSQVLYGLALRHGWGCAPDPSKALHYLSLAAQNSAAIESMALEQSGMKKGGAAKGELVLAIYELANCFRHGWGVPKKDPVAAKQYYETAANLGDVDAMNETAWCYLNGFGTKKDKLQAARYYRLAEKNGSKTLGNSWIWKEKYNTETK